MSTTVRPNRLKFAQPSFRLVIMEQRSPPAESAANAQLAARVGHQEEDLTSCQSPVPTPKDTMRRIGSAAREIFESATSPSLVPEPLSLGKKARHVSAHANIQATQQTWDSLESLKQTGTERARPKHEYHDRRRSQYALMNLSAELVANGVDAPAVANLVGLTLDELIKEVARFAIALRDTPVAVTEEIDSYHTSASDASNNEGSENGDEPGLDLTIEDVVEAWEAWEAYQEEDTLIGSESDAVEEDAINSVKDAATRTQDDQVLVPQEEDRPSVYYDALEFPEPVSVPCGNPSLQLKDQVISCSRRQANLDHVRRRRFHAVRQAQINLATQQAGLPAHVQLPRRTRPFPKILTIILLTIAAFAGRVLGVVLFELEELLFRRDLVSESGFEMIRWVLGIATILTIMVLTLRVTA